MQWEAGGNCGGGGSAGPETELYSSPWMSGTGSHASKNKNTARGYLSCLKDTFRGQRAEGKGQGLGFHP